MGHSRQRTLKNLLIVISAKLASVGALFIMGVLVARTAGPAEYGFYTAALGIVLLIDAMAGGPLDMATIRFSILHSDQPDRVSQLQATIFRIKLLLGVILLAIGLPAAQWISHVLFADNNQPSLLLMTIASAIALLLIRGTAAYLQVSSRFLTYAYLDLGQALLRILVAGILYYFGIAIAWPWLATYGVAALTAFLLALLLIRQPYLSAAHAEKKDITEIIRYLGITVLIVVLGTFTGRSDVIFLSILRTPVETGIYGVAAQVAMAGTLLAGYASILTQAKVVPMAKQGRLGELIKINLLAATGIASLLIPFCIWAISPLITVIFGTAYTAAVPLLQVLIIGTLIDLLIMPVLMPYALQLFPAQTLAGEIFITIGYLVCIPMIEFSGSILLAWLVTGVRASKLCLYAWIMTSTCKHIIDKSTS